MNNSLLKHSVYSRVVATRSAGYALITVLFALTSCIYDYPLPEQNSGSKLVVVDAFLNGTNNFANVKLSYTSALSSSDEPEVILNANVAIEDEQYEYNLYDEGNGTYSNYILVQPGNKCRLKVTLPNGKKYQSAWVTMQAPPAIDSITYSTSNIGFQVEVSTHQAEKKNPYYMWQFEETWEYTSAFASDYILAGGRPVYRNEDIYHCWHVKPSTSIRTFSTQSLAQNIVAKFPVTIIPKGSEKLAVKYGILVKQLSIDQETFEYWTALKKNTENLGSLFDPQPSQITGNISSIGDPSEQVFGYFMASGVSEQRFMISLFDLPPDFRLARDFGACSLSIINVGQIATLNESSYMIITPVPAPGPVPSEYYYATVSCSDCRLQGGTTQKPYYW